MEIYFSHIFRLVLLYVIVWLAYRLARFVTSFRNKREEDLRYRPVPQEVITKAVTAYGRNTITVVHLYRKLRYFLLPKANSVIDILKHNQDKPQGAIGYISYPSQNILIAEPLCSDHAIENSIREFVRFTQLHEKDCLLFPISRPVALVAEKMGFGLVQVGQEPVFDLRIYDSQKIEGKVQSAIHQTQKKGIVIEAFYGTEIENPKLLPELKEILQEWLHSRRSKEMQLLNEVSPFDANQDKKYFIARSQDRIEAFLACSPIYKRRGYFIHDLIRRPTAMNGISEALIVAALENMQQEGYHFASLGVAPLSGLDSAGVNEKYTALNWLLKRVYSKHQMFMRFKPLYHFKKKFAPTSVEPAYVAFYPPKLKLTHIFALINLFSPGGFLNELIYKFNQWREGSQLPHPFMNILSPNIASLPRAFPFSFREFVSRIPFTLLIFGLNIYTYYNSISWLGEVSPEVLKSYGFSYNDFFSHKWFILVTANFVHFDFLHLFGNMCLLIFACGVLEFVAGTTLAALSFLISMNADISSGIFLIPLLKVFSPSALTELMGYVDVGASLGVLGAVGSLIQFLKHKRKILLVTCVITVIISGLQKNFFGLDHTFAALMGYGIAGVYLNQRRRLKAFRKLQPSAAAMRNSSLDLAS
jgi:membrane associated rhomboid family serine protease